VLNYVAILLMFTCLLFFLIGTGSPNWITSTNSNGFLFKLCEGGSCYMIDTKCTFTPAGDPNPFTFVSCSKLNAARAFALISILFAAVTLVFMLLVSLKGSANLATPALICGVILIGTSLVAWAAFAGFDKDQSTSGSYGYSMGLFVAGWVFSIISVSLHFFGNRSATA